MDLSQWLPTATTAAFVIGAAFVADNNIKRHETVLKDLGDRLRKVELALARMGAGQGE